MTSDHAPLDALPAALRAALGEAHVITGAQAAGYEQDWRQRERGRALAVVRPGSTDEVAAVVRACVEAGLAHKGGGHAMAAGLTMHRARLNDLVAFLHARLAAERVEALADDVLDLLDGGQLHALDNQLGDAVSHPHRKGCGAVGVQQTHADLTAIARIDRAGGVGNGHAELGRQP